MKKHSFTTTQIIALGFLFTIMIGTLLLLLPVSTVKGETTGILDALFTATTSVCVTGLTVVTTASHWTLFGKCVILLLIQIGGLGVVSITTLLMLLFRKKITLKNTILMQDAYNLNTKQGLLGFTIRVFKGTLLIEALGAFVYCFSFCKDYGVLRGIWYSVFHSISAFCNAGIDILGDASLMSYTSDPLILINTSLLIIMGGIGFVVWWDVLEIFSEIRKKKIRPHMFWNSMKLQTKLAVCMTGLLILTGTLVIFLFERNNPETIGGFCTGDQILNSFFQSVTLRTAGFSSFSQSGLQEHTALFCMFCMFIGGSPVGTAGGIKTVTFAVLFFTFLSMIKERDEIVVMKRSIPMLVVKKAVTIVFISFGTVMLMTILLLATNNLSFVDSLYEVISAIATVGLSRDVTTTLNAAGRIMIIICMYLGRIGPISMAIAFNTQDSRKNLLHYPEETIIVG